MTQSNERQPKAREFDVRLGRNVRELRKARGLDQAELAQQAVGLGVPMRQQTVAKVELGQRPLRAEELDVLEQILDVEPGVLRAAHAEDFDEVGRFVAAIRRAELALMGLRQGVAGFLASQRELEAACTFATRQGAKVPWGLVDEAQALASIDVPETVRHEVEAYRHGMAVLPQREVEGEGD